ncbi:apoptotic chromatin condensation inducer in the nucleus isoform X2 [Anopheles bellator]|uniref:apoptotic chromatin condensation inducer in the nucleus isoform X2 n=1 Tax=Anopheles bellator TaxID=139047 RepID=UPI00264850F1|nr:apoptotic chromatin condensation inducer in the nucleus isoform X2 [Anopheles bellator]
MRRKASASVSTPEKATPRRSTRGRGRRSPSKSPEPEPEPDVREYAAAQDDKNNSSSDDEGTSRKGTTGKGRGRSSGTPRRKVEDRPPSRGRRTSRREKETHEPVGEEQTDENGGDNPDQEEVAHKLSDVAMEAIPEEVPQEEEKQGQLTEPDPEGSPERQRQAVEQHNEPDTVRESKREERGEEAPCVEEKASAAEEKVSHTNGDEDDDGEGDDGKQADSRDADDDSKEIVNNRSRTRQESDSEESGQDDEGSHQEHRSAKESTPDHRHSAMEHTADESANAEHDDAAVASGEEKSTAVSPAAEQKEPKNQEEVVNEVATGCLSQQAMTQPQPRRRARFSSRPNDEPSVPVVTACTEATVEPVAVAQIEDELEAGEIKDNDNSMSEANVDDTSGTKEQPPRPKPLQRKRRWLSSKSGDPKPAVITISTDSLKSIISDVKPVPLADVKLESSSETEAADGAESTEEDDKEKEVGKRPAQPPARRRVSQSVEKENVAMETDSTSIEPVLPKQKAAAGEKIGLTRKISIVSDEGSVPGGAMAANLSVRPPSPAKHHTSNILYITNLVRPFTVLQLKGLLLRTGKIVENGFWIDKIKSKCYVKYETEDEATETRHALHGIRWPVSNPKCLLVDFGSEEAMDKAILSTLEDGTIRATVEGVKNSKEFGWLRDASKKDEEVPARPVREWDLGKKDAFDAERDREGRGRDRESGTLADERHREKAAERNERGRLDEGRERGNRADGLAGDRGADRKRSLEREFGRERRRSSSMSPARKFKKKENEPPIRLLDDLFRKTKTTPCIYWLPLTTEQIAVKEEQRRKNMAEHQRRLEEQRKLEEERERERKRERERRERERERDRDRERDRERDRDRDRDRRRSRSRDRSRDDGGRRRHR